MSNAIKLMQEQKALLPTNGPVPNRRVLVVDDEIAIAEGIRLILCPNAGAQAPRSSRSAKVSEAPKSSEFEVVVVNNPKDALQAIQQSLMEDKPFAVGFFDVMLGAEIDGIELVKQAFALDPRLFSVFVTAYHDRNVDNIGSYLGEEFRERWDYINKPFSNGEILQKARNATSLWDLQRLKDWQAERLSEANQLLVESEKQNAIAAVARSVAHEFGNLLTHIIGQAEIAKGETDVPTIHNALDVILKASDTATTVLKRLSHLNETQDSSSEFSRLDVRLVIEEALELMEFRFRRHSVKVDKKQLKNVQIDAHRNSLIQVMVNLFINALHAMPGGGKLHLSLEADQENVVIRVRDSGVGIPEEIMHRVTEPLFTTKGKNGSGLGLAICKEIIEIEHKGQFALENHPQGGLQVSLTLPLAQEEK